MMIATRAGLLYAAIIFVFGVVLGTLRTMILLPLLGATAAVLIEAPLMLVLCWIVCGRVIHRLNVPPTLGARAVMGLVALLTLAALEWPMGILLFDLTLTQILLSYLTPEGMIGLAAQIAFAAFPLLQLMTAHPTASGPQ